MRTLPLGVLIVCGGTFAALPFRRYQPAFPPVSDPFQATGPSESTLFPLDFETSNLRADVVQLERSVVDGRLVSEVDSTSSSGISELRSMPRQISRRASDIPLTFEDLAAPIEHPGTARDRWVQAGTSDSSADTGAAGDALVGVPQGHPRRARTWFFESSEIRFGREPGIKIPYIYSREATPASAGGSDATCR